MEDAEIVDLFFQRSEQAIPETAAKYQGLIFQISRNILENPQDAEECVNDTYLGLTEINFVKEISAKAHGDGYMSFSSNFWLDFVTVWGVIRLNLEPTQKADCISRIFIPKIDFPAWAFGTPSRPTGPIPCWPLSAGLPGMYL